MALLGRFGTPGQCAQAQRAIAMKHMSRIPFPSLGNTKVITGVLAPRSPSSSFRSPRGCVFFCCSVPYVGVRWVGAGWSVGGGEGGGVWAVHTEIPVRRHGRVATCTPTNRPCSRKLVNRLPNGGVRCAVRGRGGGFIYGELTWHHI